MSSCNVSRRESNRSVYNYPISSKYTSHVIRDQSHRGSSDNIAERDYTVQQNEDNVATCLQYNDKTDGSVSSAHMANINDVNVSCPSYNIDNTENPTVIISAPSKIGYSI